MMDFNAEDQGSCWCLETDLHIVYVKESSNDRPIIASANAMSSLPLMASLPVFACVPLTGWFYFRHLKHFVCFVLKHFVCSHCQLLRQVKDVVGLLSFAAHSQTLVC